MFGSVAICVECSLSPCNVNDCLRTYAFCKHSNSPQFNRDKRVLNRLPIYFGEDIVDKINREALLKDIVLNPPALKSITVLDSNAYDNGRYSLELPYQKSNGRESRNFGPADTSYKWVESSVRGNVVPSYIPYKTYHSNMIGYLYTRKDKAKEKFRNWFNSFRHNRIVKKFNYDMDKMYGATVPPISNSPFPLYDDAHYWIKQIKSYHPLKRTNTLREEIINRKKNGIYDNVHIVFQPKMRSVQEISSDYWSEVDNARFYAYVRYLKLWYNSNDKYEKIWYLMKMGMLCYRNLYQTDNEISHGNQFLGTLKSHQLRVNTHSNTLWHTTYDYYDLRQMIYKIQYYTSDSQYGDIQKHLSKLREVYLHNDIYEDEHCDWCEFINHDILIPKINHIKDHYKKNVLSQLKQRRKTRNDCGRTRGPNIRTTNPYYCFLTNALHITF